MLLVSNVTNQFLEKFCNMNLDGYLSQLNFAIKSISKIEHEDCLSSTVYKIILKDDTPLILKIFYHSTRYRREAYFLNRLQKQLPVPEIIDCVEPDGNLQGALVMECIPGEILQPATLTETQSFKMGVLLARVHQQRTQYHGDLTQPDENKTPKQGMFDYLNESIAECEGVISPLLLDNSRKYFENNMVEPDEFDGPCIVHYDFKPGNVLMYNGEITGLIDWENSRSSFAQEDFFRMHQLVWRSYPELKKSFFRGYASIREMPKLEKLLPLLFVSKSLGTLGFTIVRKTWQTQHKNIFEENLTFLKNFLKKA